MLEAAIFAHLHCDECSHPATTSARYELRCPCGVVTVTELAPAFINAELLSCMGCGVIAERARREDGLGR